MIIAEGKAAGISPQGWLIALATAFQESGLKALAYGDRDSQGIYQQRPSTGWGSVGQVRDPVLSTRAFYGVAAHTSNPGLTDIRNWQTMPVPQAAQAVQRSAFPDAYAKWEPAARSIVQQLAGIVAPGSVDPYPDPAACAADVLGAGAGCPPTGLAAEQGLTPDALLVIRCGKKRFPQLKTIHGLGGRDGASDHPSGRAADFMVNDLPGYLTGQGSTLGWEIARWMRANHSSLAITYVIYANRICNVDRDAAGWRPYNRGSGDTALHYDHVHVSVHGNRGTGLPGAGQGQVNGRGWALPLPEGRYRVGCSITCYPGHTGQDFPAADGTPVYASHTGTVIRSAALTESGRYVSYGNLIVIRSTADPKVPTFYAHLSRRSVQAGTPVRAGQVIGASGNTGNSEGPHLHFEVRVGASPVDPMPILRQNGLTP